MTATPLPRSVGTALVDLTAALRPDWHRPGIEAAVRQAATTAPTDAVVLATIRAALDHGAQTPGVIPRSGSHWHDGRARASSPPPPPPACPEHPTHPAGRCKECRAAAAPAPLGWRNRTATAQPEEMQ